MRQSSAQADSDFISNQIEGLSGSSELLPAALQVCGAYGEAAGGV